MDLLILPYVGTLPTDPKIIWNDINSSNSLLGYTLLYYINIYPPDVPSMGTP